MRIGLTLATAGATCLGLAIGWAAARPRGLWALGADLALALVAGCAVVLLLVSASAAATLAIATMAGLGLRLLLDLYLSRIAKQGRR